MTPNEYADFWRHEIGVNVIPANSKKKIPLTEWKEYQTQPIPQEIHDEWKSKGLFNQGMAVICGQVFHNKEHLNKWLNGIDCDNKLGLDVMCPSGIDKIASITIVEQHKNKNKCHIYFYTKDPIKSKSANDGKQNTVPQIEIKSEGKFLLYCSGSIHKDNSPIEILGINKVKTVDKEPLEERIDSICKEYSIPYLSGISKTQKPIQEITKKDFVLHEGENRSLAIIRYLDSKKINNPEFDESILFNIGKEYNQDHCKPPYDESKIRSLTKQALGYGEKKLEEKENEVKPLEVKAKELLETLDKKEALEKLKEYSIVIGDKKGDTILKEILKKATSKIKNNLNEEITPTIKAYNTGMGLIQKTVKSKNDTEQIVIQVKINDKPHWIDIRSPTFNQMVRLGVQKDFKEIYGSNQYETAITNLHAHSLFNGTEIRQIFNRSALVDGVLYYDLQDLDGTIYKISKDEIIEAQNEKDIPIFLKSQSSRTEASVQPKPLFDDDEAFDKLIKLYRIKDEDKIIFKSHLICYFLTDFPIPIAIIHGEQGSAKTTTTKGMKLIHDPEGECALSLPEKVDDLAVNLSRHGTSNFDNTDSFDKELSQFLCRAVTGTQYVKRQLFSNGEEFSLTLKSKIILNGISPTIDQPDLLERSIFYELPTIPKTERMTDGKSLDKLNELKPHVIGFIFKTIQKAMKIYDEVDKELEGESLPRMASFAVWGEAISRSLGHEPLAFIKRYEEKQESSNLGLRDEFPVLDPLMDFVSNNSNKDVSMTELYQRVVDPSKVKDDERIPKDSKRLGKQLKQLSPTIRALGFEVSTRVNNSRTEKKFARGVTLVNFTKINESGVDSY